MEKDNVKILICVILFLVFGGLTVLFCMLDLNLGFISTSSIEGIIAKREQLLNLESKLESTESTYTTTKNKVETSKKAFTTAKNKYEAISDETIDLIKEATTEENYDIEYMWIKLGNYASVNNLKILVVEPGGTVTETTSGDATKAAANSTTSTSTSTNTNTNASTSNNSTSTQASTSTASTDASKAANTATTAAAENTTANNTTSSKTTDDTLLTVTLEGSYLNMSDFVFEVENDKELRFKLDNMEVTYVSGTTIKAKFNVKNVIMIK